MTRAAMRAVLGLVVGAGLTAACTSAPGDSEGTDVDAATVVWDFTTPVTATDLGSKVDEFVELDGPVRLQVTFPSGRTVADTWARGAIGLARGGANLGGPPQPIEQVDLLEDEATTVEEVRASADRFVAEFGPARRGRDGQTLDEYLDEFERRVAADGGEIVAARHGEGDGSLARSFSAVEQDGLSPGWLIRVVDGGATLRTVVQFKAAPAS